MQFLKILFWCLIAFIAAIFTLENWTSVTVQLWGGVEVLINLPLLLLLTFLAGLLPTLAWHSTLRWRLRNRLATAERTLADLRAAEIRFTGQELSDLVLGVVLPRLGGRDWKTAIVVDQPIQFGVSRQYQVFADRYSTDCIFHDPEEAIGWLLGLP